MTDDDLRALIPADLVEAHRKRAFHRTIPSSAARRKTPTFSSRPARR
jgi:hypothetical protein